MVKMQKGGRSGNIVKEHRATSRDRQEDQPISKRLSRPEEGKRKGGGEGAQRRRAQTALHGC